MYMLLSCCCLILFSLASLSDAQIEIDGCLLQDLTDDQVELLISTDSSAGEGGNPDITVTGRFENCRAVGRLRNRFRSVTETVTFLGRPSDPATEQTAQLDFFCFGDAVNNLVAWDLGSLEFVTDDAIISTLMNSSIATDCARCTGDNPDDELLHCDRCDDECLEEEQRLCYGSTSATCCNVYINNVCMNECPPNQIATEASNFECFCNLPCINGGTPSNDCTQCICPSPLLTGPFCEDPCSPDQCVNGDCSPDGAFPGFNCTCDPEFTGTFCETPIDPCDGIDCSGNGDCVAVGITEFECQCDAGFMGELCEEEINQCEPNPCLNGGTCVREDFPNFRCECLPNFSGDTCENCDLSNCRICSRTDGICDECFNGFLLTEGVCAVNCTICNQRETQCQRNTCNFYCLLNAWSEDANAQGLSVPSFEEPSSDLSKLQQVQQISRDASSAERIWTREAATTSELLDSLQPPPRTGVTLDDWVSDSTVWLENIIDWLEYVTAEVDPDFPAFDFRSLIAQLEPNPQETYESVISLWREVTNAYTSRVLS